MYNERYESKKDGFSIKDIIVQLLFIVLFVFILIWLFPTKNSLNGKFDSIDKVNEKFDVLTNRIFNDNLQTMKDAAINYYTTPRLPKNVNDVKSMTLREMLKEKLLVEFKDANNKSCDLDDSYVEVTKLDDEFLLKVNLSCTDNDAYILVHLGCYDYCSTDVCEKKDTKTNPVVNVQPTVTPSVPSKPSTPAQKTCSYKYQKVVTDSKWSGWSKWSTKQVSATSTRKVDTKTEVETVYKDVLKGYQKTTYRDMDNPIVENVQVQTETVSSTYCTSYTSQYTSTGQKKYEWIDQGTSYYNSQPQPDSNTKYEYVGKTTVDCADCYNGVLYIYRKYTLKVYDVVSANSVCASWGTVSAPIYITVPKIVGYNTYTKVVPVYEKQQVTEKVKYYRYKTLSTTSETLTKWSSSSNDTTLINQGYKYVTSVCN